MLERQCVHCGKVFLTKGPMRKYCSTDCYFLDKVKEAENGCIEWTGFFNRVGYGQLRLENRKMMLAHRFAWERVNGPIPKGMCVCHKCDNMRCVNVEHLFLGTQQDNIADMVAKGRNKPGTYSEERRAKYAEMTRGVKCPKAKLNDEKALAIYNDKRPFNEIAAEYGVVRSAIEKIKYKKTWKHIHADNVISDN